MIFKSTSELMRHIGICRCTLFKRAKNIGVTFIKQDGVFNIPFDVLHELSKKGYDGRTDSNKSERTGREWAEAMQRNLDKNKD